MGVGTRFRSALSHPRAYWLLQRSLGAERVHRHVLEEHAQVSEGERVLDIGCGPGQIHEVLPGVDYLGLDMSPEYIAAARRHYGDRGEFRLVDAAEADLSGEEPFDLALAVGVVHHLDDGEARRLARLAGDALKPGGRFVTLDPGLAPGQPAVARWLASRDRGEHVRAPDAYEALARSAFEDVRAEVHHDLAVVPYTHVVLECRRPVRA